MILRFLKTEQLVKRYLVPKTNNPGITRDTLYRCSRRSTNLDPNCRTNNRVRRITRKINRKMTERHDDILEGQGRYNQDIVQKKNVPLPPTHPERTLSRGQRKQTPKVLGYTNYKIEVSKGRGKLLEQAEKQGGLSDLPQNI